MGKSKPRRRPSLNDYTAAGNSVWVVTRGAPSWQYGSGLIRIRLASPALSPGFERGRISPGLRHKDHTTAIFLELL
jgi:hypothetical protein